jgi:hypothetical protein
MASARAPSTCGTPFPPPVPEHVPLELIAARTFGLRVIYERYRRARDDSD